MIGLRNSITVALVVSVLLLLTATVGAEEKATWHREAPPERPAPVLFHSTHLIDLPTATTVSSGLFQFEIAHRFLPPIADGSEVFFGLDGPVNMRIGLSYAVANRLMVTLARSNLSDNVDLQAKYRFYDGALGDIKVATAVQTGVGWNTELPGRSSSDNRSWQPYAVAIFNAQLGSNLAVGLAPSLLLNAYPDAERSEHSVGLGLSGQYHVTRVMSFMVEWNISESSRYASYDAVSIGFELETGGHFFKVFATNSVRLNLSQYLIGTEDPFDPDRWHLGFGITRLLKI